MFFEHQAQAIFIRHRVCVPCLLHIILFACTTSVGNKERHMSYGMDMDLAC
jgi:hypothetical protein